MWWIRQRYCTQLMQWLWSRSHWLNIHYSFCKHNSCIVFLKDDNIFRCKVIGMNIGHFPPIHTAHSKTMYFYIYQNTVNIKKKIQWYPRKPELQKIEIPGKWSISVSLNLKLSFIQRKTPENQKPQNSENWTIFWPNFALQYTILPQKTKLDMSRLEQFCVSNTECLLIRTFTLQCFIELLYCHLSTQ